MFGPSDFFAFIPGYRIDIKKKSEDAKRICVLVPK